MIMSTELLDAARSGNLYKIQSLLGSGTNINFQNNDQDTALHIATLTGGKDVVTFLIGRGAAVNATNYCQETPLHKAAIRGNVPVIEALLKAGAYKEAHDHLGYTPLHAAISSNRNSEVIQTLIGQGCDIFTTNDAGESLLHTAAREGSPETVEFLLNQGLSPELQDNDGNRPLHAAASGQNSLKRDVTQVISLLLSRAANIHATNVQQQTALHCAAASGELRNVVLLCENGASLLAKDYHGRLPVHIALGTHALDIEEYLLSQNITADTPPIEASKDAPVSAVEVLVSASFFEKKEQLQSFREVLDLLYKNPFFQPAIDLAAIHALGTRRQHKALRFFLVSGKDSSSIFQKADTNAYNPASHVAVIDTSLSYEKLLGVVAHDLTRHAAQFAFRNATLPFAAEDVLMEKSYKAAIDRDVRESYQALGIQEKEIQRAVIGRTLVFSKASQKLPEFNAGAAQAIALFGAVQVEKVCPALTRFFTTQFLPLCAEARNAHPTVQLLLPAPQVGTPILETFASVFPPQYVNNTALNATVVTELVSLAVLAKLGQPKTSDAPPSALQTGYILERDAKETFTKLLGQLEKVLERDLDAMDLPEEIPADDVRKFVKTLAGLYMDGITRKLLSPSRKQVKQVIRHWQDGFFRLTPRATKQTLLEKLASRYLSGAVSENPSSSKKSVKLSETFSLSALIDQVKYAVQGMEAPVIREPRSAKYSMLPADVDAKKTQAEDVEEQA